MKNKEMKIAAGAFAALSDEDWCTTQVHECAMLLGVVPVSSISPAVGHFHTMLEAARAAKTNKKNADIGDLGQRLRLAWKQSSLIDQRAGNFFDSKTSATTAQTSEAAQRRLPMTLHPRVHVSPETFDSIMLPFWMFMMRSLYFESSDCPKILEGGQQQIRVSPYTPASFARLVSHSLRFLKLDSSHALKLVETLHGAYSEGLFGADVVSQLDLHFHLLSLYKSEALRAADVVRWARNCPWWDRKPPSEGIIPPGSPGVCRVVMLASEEVVAIVRQLRAPALCILLNDESQGVKTMISTLHYCFVRVDRGSGSFPPEDKEGAPWFVLRDRLLRVKETHPDDPEAELMVSFLLGSSTILSAKAAQIELELRLQDSAARNAAPSGVAKSLEAAEGVIFRTKLSERSETAVVFPTKKPNATTLERWLPQSSKRRALVLDDKGVEPGLGPRRVGKMNRYIITPGRPELFVPQFHPCRHGEDRPGQWGNKQTGHGYLLWTLHMSNPAARALLADKQMNVIMGVMPPCGIEVIMDAPEKNDGGKSKRKRKTGDLSRGGVDGGLECVAVMPFPVESVEENARGNDWLELVAYFEDPAVSPFVNVLHTYETDGTKLSPPLMSNWSYPVRCPPAGRRLKACQATEEFVNNLELWRSPPQHFVGTPFQEMHLACRVLLMEHMRARTVELPGGGGRWHTIEAGDVYFEADDNPLQRKRVLEGASVWIMVRVEDVLVDESNECLLLDVSLAVWDLSADDDFLGDFSATYSSGFSDPVPRMEQLLPLAVERGRRTYSHRPDCHYLRSSNRGSIGWDGQGYGGLEEDELDIVPLCSCGMGKDIPEAVTRELQHLGQPEVLSRMYRAVLPTLTPLSDIGDYRLKSPALVADSSTGGGDREVRGPGAFSHLKEPVGQSCGAKLSYSGPIREHGSIVESVPVAAVQERGGGFAGQPSGSSRGLGLGVEGGDGNSASKTANGKGDVSSTARGGDALAGVDKETRQTLSKAGLKRMPATSYEWVRFERAQKGLPPEPPCPGCNKHNATKKCTRCKIVRYCSRECQRKHWPVHSKECYADK